MCQVNDNSVTYGTKTRDAVSAAGRGGRIICGDCVEVMAGFPAESIECIVTDPPYGVQYKDRLGRSVHNDDNTDWLLPSFTQMYRVLERDGFCVSFYGWSRMGEFWKAWKASGFRVVGHLTFPKRYASCTRILKYQHENAFLLAKGNPKPHAIIGDVVDWMSAGNGLHPTQKPLGVLAPLVKAFSKPGGIVLDPFCGSGSSLMAAKLLGRRYVGMELDDGHYRTAVQRLAQPSMNEE